MRCGVLHDLYVDLSHFYDALLRVCTAVEGESDAVKSFYFLVTGTKAKIDSRAAAL